MSDSIVNTWRQTRARHPRKKKKSASHSTWSIKQGSPLLHPEPLLALFFLHFLPYSIHKGPHIYKNPKRITLNIPSPSRSTKRRRHDNYSLSLSPLLSYLLLLLLLLLECVNDLPVSHTHLSKMRGRRIPYDDAHSGDERIIKISNRRERERVDEKTVD